MLNLIFIQQHTERKNKCHTIWKKIKDTIRVDLEGRVAKNLIYKVSKHSSFVANVQKKSFISSRMSNIDCVKSQFSWEIVCSRYNSM